MIRGLKSLLPRSLKRRVRQILQNVRESAVYSLRRPKIGGSGFNHVVFVCKGNICRSAFAECYLKARIPAPGIRIESCGLDADQGSCSPPEAVKVGLEFGLDLQVHRARGLGVCDLETADLIVPMEYAHYRRLRAIMPEHRGKIRMLRDFAPWPARLLCNTYDPYGLGETEFRGCFRGMRESLEGMASFLAAEDGGKRDFPGPVPGRIKEQN